MKTTAKKITVLVLLALILMLLVSFVAMSVQNVAYAADEETTTASSNELQIAQEKTKQIKGWTAAIVIAGGAVAGAVCMGLAIIKAIDGITRQPEAESKIRTTLMLGLVFIETAIIYALIVAILLVFVL